MRKSAAPVRALLIVRCLAPVLKALRCFRQRDLSLRTLMLAYCRPVEIWVIR